MSIAANYERLRQEIPDNVAIVLAAKTRSVEEVAEAVDAGATHIGENYVQEAETVYDALGEKARKLTWHMIGHLQKNKINKALGVFDVIQSVDSLKKARQINKRAAKAGREKTAVYIEINIGSEFAKAGIKPEEHEPFEQYMKDFVAAMAEFENLSVEGLMTMGPLAEDPQRSRPYFRRTRQIFESLKLLDVANVQMKYLSMGMTNSYKVAIEEGANMVRIGTAIFGERQYG